MQELIIEKVKNYIISNNLINHSDKVLIALSGGADSMALTHILLTLSDQLGFTICAAHLNHSLRGNESDYDEMFVNNYCNKNGISVISEKIDVNKFSHESKIGIEEAARIVRYDFLSKAAKLFNANKIATAHSLSDNAESVILNITRGCGLSGITAIPERRGNIIRPILCLTRFEIEEYDKYFSIPYVTDSTNKNIDYTRNFIRQEIIPRLIDINPQFLNAIDRLVTSAKEDNQYLLYQSDELLNRAQLSNNTYDVDVLSKASIPILKRALCLAFTKFTKEKLSFAQMNDFYSFVLSNKNGYHQLPLGKFAYIESGFLELRDSASRKEVKRFYLSADEYNILPDNRIVKIVSNLSNIDFQSSFDADKIVGSLTIRLKNSFDNIKLNKRPNKSLKKLFNEKKIPISKRDSTIVVCDDEGVIWVDNIGVAERVCVDDYSKKIYKITIEE